MVEAVLVSSAKQRQLLPYREARNVVRQDFHDWIVTSIWCDEE